MRVLFLILFFAALNCTEAQTFFDSSNTYLCVGKGMGRSYSHHKYRMILDSIVSDTEYYKMENDYYGVKSSNAYRFKFIKGKVLYHYKGSNRREMLLYDFSLKEGDTTRVGGFTSMIFPNSLLTVDSIRLVQFGGKIRKGMYVHVANMNWPFLWIENIGSIENGVLYTNRVQMETYNELVNVCHADSLWYWKNHEVIKSGASTCNPVFYGSSIQSSDFHGYKMFPNPFNNEVHFLDWDGHVVDLKIYDVNGQIVFDEVVDTDMGLDLSKLAKGFYCVKMSNGLKFSTQILVKE